MYMNIPIIKEYPAQNIKYSNIPQPHNPHLVILFCMPKPPPPRSLPA
jgi:hypothetical protein